MVEFLTGKLKFDREFVDDELGCVEVKRVRDAKNREKLEAVVTFESRQVRETRLNPKPLTWPITVKKQV